MPKIGRCKSCGAMPTEAIEAVELTTTFAIRGDGTLEGEGYHDHGRGTLSLTARCECGHSWRIPLRRALTMLLEKTGKEATHA